MESMAVAPTESIPKACNGCSETMAAACRFFDNASVDWRAMFPLRALCMVDSESDLLPLMVRAQQTECPADWRVRVALDDQTLGQWQVFDQRLWSIGMHHLRQYGRIPRRDQ
jgi:hypothetical protein